MARSLRFEFLLSLGLFATLASNVSIAQTPVRDLQSARLQAEQNPRDVSVLLLWSQAALRANEPVEALQAASSAQALAPSDASVLPYLARAQVLSGRLEDALSTIGSIAEDERRATGLNNTASAIEVFQGIGPTLEAADQSGSVDDYEQVAARLAEAANLAPEVGSLNKTLGFIYLDKLRQPEQALPYLERAAQSAPGDKETNTLLARDLLELGQFQRSATLYRGLVQDDPQNIDVQLNLADALIGLRSRQEAEALIAAILQSQPNNVRALMLQEKAREASKVPVDTGLPKDNDVVSPAAKALQLEASQLIGQGDSTKCLTYYYEAIQRLQRALQLEPNSHTLYETLGYVYLEKVGQQELAYQALCRALQIRPDQLSTQKLIAIAALRTGRTQEAIARFRAVLRRDPSDLWMLVNLGRAYAQAGEFACAMEIFETVLARDACNFTARLGMAEVMAWRGLSDRPREIVEGLVREQPRNSEALNLLGDLQRWDWDFQTAAPLYQRANAADPARRAGRTGLYEIEKAQSYVATTDGYQFTDNFGFKRSFYGAGFRMPLSDKAYLTPRAVFWDYRQSGQQVQRTDTIMDLEYHFNRQFETTAQLMNFDYSNRSSQQSGSISSKYQPISAIALYTTAGWGEPAVLTNFSIPLFNVRMDNYATGYDIRMTKRLTTQGQFAYGSYYDGNERRFGMSQLSFQPNRDYLWFTRLRYENLSFADQTPVYFSPDSFDLLRFKTDVSLPLTARLRLDSEAEAIDVLSGGGWGWGYRVGPTWTKNDRVRVQAAYFTTTIPGVANFTGNGFNYNASLRF